MDLAQLRVFVRVVQAGSFTRAAEVLHTQKSRVSRVLTQLEAQLGVKLLERSTRSLSMTEIGREVFERAVGILGAVEDTERVAQSMQGEPRGLLRLTCGVEFGMIAVNGWVNEFLARHPQASVEVEHTARLVDLVHEGFDLAIRIGTLEESRLAARPLGHLDYGLFACPRYLEQRGEPRSIDALRQHDLLMFSGGTQRGGWRLADGRESVRIEGPARLRVNNSFAVRSALLRSMGVGQLPLIVAAEAVAAGKLRRILPRWAPPAVPVHAVYPSNRYLTPKVRAFVDLAVAQFPAITQARPRIQRAASGAAAARPRARRS